MNVWIGTDREAKAFDGRHWSEYGGAVVGGVPYVKQQNRSWLMLDGLLLVWDERAKINAGIAT